MKFRYVAFLEKSENLTNNFVMSVFEGGGMVFNATFNNISVISWQSVLLVEKPGVPRENHGPVASH